MQTNSRQRYCIRTNSICQTHHKSHEHEQHLSNAEEQRIVEACLHMDDIGLPVTVDSVHQYAESIYCACEKLKSV